MFGITVDNSRSNVDADVIQRVWVDKFTVFEKQETIPAGESIQSLGLKSAKISSLQLSLKLQM